MASIQLIRTRTRYKRSDPRRGRPGRREVAPVAAGRREGGAVGYDCPRCGGRHRHEPAEAVSVVRCPASGGAVVLAVAGGVVP